jgi:transcriptional regulator with XRE-family HTH domain
MGKSNDIEIQLREAIEDSGMSRYKISQLSGISEASLSLFANRKRTLTLESAAKIAEVLGLELKPTGGK